MCGIVGYIGKKNGTPIVLDGLSKLEYRGYDSAGIAYIRENNIHIERTQGKLLNLTEKVIKQDIESHTIIGHTRWATHGRPSEINAHPHSYGKIALVHNGIVENYLELKGFLTEERNDIFNSDTDSEVIAHVIDFFYEGDLLKATAQAMKKIDGSFALAIIHEDHPDQIILARRSSPLVVTISEDGGFAASDIPAILKYSKNFIYLEDNDIALLTENSVSIFDKTLTPVDRETHFINWNPSMAEKGGFRHFMLKEIHEQDRAIMDTLRGRINRTRSDIDLLENDAIFEDISKIFIVACGTSWHAALVAKFYIESLARIPVEVDLASEFRYRDPIFSENNMVVVISQSGETADTLAALRTAKEHNIKTLGVCNVVGSTIAREADEVLYTYAGPEIGVASTKAFTTQLVAMYLLALKLGLVNSNLSRKQITEHIRCLSEIPDLVNQIIHKEEEIEKIAHTYYRAQDFLFLGRGYNYPIALEGALKLKEISYIHAEGYPAGELKHGPLALVDKNIPVVAIMPENDIFGKMFSNVKEVRARDGIIISFASEDNREIADVSDAIITMPHLSTYQEPILYVIPLQLLSYYIAVNKGTDVDQPRNLAKSVTVE